MSSSARSESDWNRRRYPILAGAISGLVAGIVGLFVTTTLSGSPVGSALGAVGCGVTGVYLTDGGLNEALTNALVADLVSSVAFFVLVLACYFAFVWSTEGLSVVGAPLGSALYVTVGGLGVAVPIALLSLALTAFTGKITAVTMNRFDAPPSSR